MIDRIMNINTVDRSNKLFKSIWRLDESSSNHRHKWTVHRKQRLFISLELCLEQLTPFLNAEWN